MCLLENEDFGSFDDAYMLLKRQIVAVKNYEKALPFHYYKNKCDISKLSDEKERRNFFNKKISKNKFYLLGKEFFVVDYLIPKKLWGSRRYKFFSFSLLWAYYAVGIYLAKICGPILDYKKGVLAANLKNNNEGNYETFSGTQLNFKDGRLEINGKVLYYQSHYASFLKKIKDSIKDEKEYIVFHIDLENYFDNINVSVLLEFIDVNFQLNQDLEYSASRKKEIVDFISYIQAGKGLPQSDKNIVSSYLSDVFLIKSDFKIIDFLRNKKLPFNFYRYIDDLYLIVERNDTLTDKNANSVLQEVSDIYLKEVGLKINTNKSKIFYLENRNDKEIFLKTLKDTSLANEDGGVAVYSEEILKILEDVKKYPKKNEAELIFCEKGLRLNDLFGKDAEGNRLIDYIKNVKKVELENVFLNFNYDLVNISPTAFLALVWSSDKIKKSFLEFFKNKSALNFFDLYLLENYILEGGIIIESAIKDNAYKKIFSICKEGVCLSGEPMKGEAYLNIVDKIGDKEDFIVQVKRRVISERNRDYNLAFNHLVNEFHNFCLSANVAYVGDKKDYDQNCVCNFLFKIGVPNNQIVSIKKMFFRRHKNNISHPGGVALDQGEYESYKTIVLELYKNIYVK